MDTKELLAKHTNENGEINYDTFNVELKELQQAEIDRVAKKKDDKAKRKIDQLVNEYEQKIQAQQQTEQVTTNDPDPVEALQKEVEQLKQQTAREKAVTNFKARANDMQINDEIVNTLVQTVDDLDNFDLSPFKQNVQTITPVEHVEKKENTTVDEKSKARTQYENFLAFSKNKT